MLETIFAACFDPSSGLEDPENRGEKQEVKEHTSQPQKDQSEGDQAATPNSSRLPVDTALLFKG